jgi:hypothetical protein
MTLQALNCCPVEPTGDIVLSLLSSSHSDKEKNWMIKLQQKKQQTTQTAKKQRTTTTTN